MSYIRLKKQQNRQCWKFACICIRNTCPDRETGERDRLQITHVFGGNLQ